MPGLSLLILLLILAALVVPLIPLRRRRRGLAGFPAVTTLLLVSNILIFAGSSANGSLTDSIAFEWGLVPRAATVLGLFTHMFLHGSVSHLFGNLLGLWLFGPHVEEALGRLEYLLFYIGSGISGALLHVIVAATLLPAAATLPLVGASGAIFGVLGLFAIRFWRARVRVLLVAQIPAVWAVGLFALLQVYFGIQSFADGGRSESTANWAHIGGFLFGLLIAVPLKMREDGKREYHLEDAEKALATGNLDQAAAYYREIVSARPGDAAAHRTLAQVCVALRQGEAAHRHFMDALRLYLRAGEAPAVAGVYEDACRSFERFPLPPSLLLRVASCCEEVQHYPLALTTLSDLCRDHPEAREAELALLRLGKLHLQKLGQPQNATAIFSEFLRLYPSSEWHDHARRLLSEAARLSQTFAAPATTNPLSGGAAAVPPAAGPAAAPQQL